jgi:hypothetical protein
MHINAARAKTTMPAAAAEAICLHVDSSLVVVLIVIAAQRPDHFVVTPAVPAAAGPSLELESSISTGTRPRHTEKG